LSDTYKTAKSNFITSWAEDIIRSSYYILSPQCCLRDLGSDRAVSSPSGGGRGAKSGNELMCQ